MKRLLDFSAARPSGASIKKVADGVVRYVSYSAWKNLTASEVKDYLASDLEIGVVWETTAQRCLSGFSGGVADATEALKQVKSLLPEVIPIYFAVDFAITEGQLSTLDEYLNGAASVIGKDLVGVYGSYLVIEHCFERGTAKWFWQTLAWSGGKISSHNHIYQDGKTPPIKDTDNNVAVDDWGGYKQPGTSDKFPSELLDLTNWKITLPIGNPTEIKQPNLSAFSQKPYFYAEDSGVVFQAPVNGATTSGSGYPRSELREMNGSSLASWSNRDGRHSMFETLSIEAVPKKKKHIVVAQIHDANDDVIVIRLEYPKLFVDMGGTEVKVLNSNYVLGTMFSIGFVAENGKIKVHYNGSVEPVYTKDLNIDKCYFKAGAYTQSNCSKEDDCSESNYGKMIIYKLKVEHSDMPTPEPIPTPTPTPIPVPTPTPPPNGMPSPTPATKGKVVSRKQGDSRWGSVKLGNTNRNVAGDGCVVVCISDALYWLGIDLLPDYLAKNLRFTFNYPGLPDGLIYWDSITEKTRGKFVVRYRTFSSIIVNAALKHPTQCVFLEFNYAGARHWCFVLGRDWLGRYRIADPLQGNFGLASRYGSPVGLAIMDIK